MRLVRRLTMLAAAALLTTGITAASAASASAQTRAAAPQSTARVSMSPSARALAEAVCPPEAFCAWKDADREGTQWNYNAELLPRKEWLPIHDCSTNNEQCFGASDQISSFFSNRVFVTYIAKNFPVDATGANICSGVHGGGISEDLSLENWSDGSSMNDSISAIRLTEVNQVDRSFCTSQPF